MKRKSSVKKILIMGFFGVNNLGDDIMLDVFCRALCANCSYSVTVLNLYGCKKNYNLPKEIKLIDISQFKHGKTVIISQYLSRIYDALFWIGGTCFTENAGNGAYSYMKAFYNRGKKYGYIGVGIGDVVSKGKQDMYRWLLNNASLVTFRDKDSFKTGQEWSLNPQMYLCEDLVYLYENTPLENKSIGAKGYLLISWRSYKGYYENDIEEKAISDLCQYVMLHKKNYSHVYIAILGNNVDIERNREIYSKLSNYVDATFLDSLSTESKIELIRGAKTVVTGRLHGVFLAEINHVNTVAIGYDNKLKRFMESIDATKDLVFPDNMTLGNISKAAENKTYISDKTIACRRKSALKNVDLFCDFINGI